MIIFARVNIIACKYWTRELNRFFEFNRTEVLIDKGHITHQQAEEKAMVEYKKFRIVQDRVILNDFDRQLELILGTIKQ